MTTPGPTQGVAGFAVRFIVAFGLLMGAFEASRGTAFERVVIEEGLLRPTTWLAQSLAPAEPVHLVGRSIETAHSRLHVVRGCEGVETLLLLAAALLAYPASWVARGWGLLVGTLIAYVLSVGRLLALHLALRYSPHAWGALHGLVLPLAPVILVAWYFLQWSAAQSRTDSAGAPAHAP